MDPLAANQPAPDFSLLDLQGRLHRLAEYRGNIVVLNFWSAECPHAARVDAALLLLLQSLPGVTLLPIASNANEDAEQARQAAEARRLPLVLLDADHQVADRYGAAITPHLFLVDAGGLLRYQGAFDDVTFRQRQPTRGYLQEALEALLVGQPPARANTPPFGCSLVRY